MGVSIKGDTPKCMVCNAYFMEKPIKMNELGVPPFQETSIFLWWHYACCTNRSNLFKISRLSFTSFGRYPNKLFLCMESWTDLQCLHYLSPQNLQIIILPVDSCRPSLFLMNQQAQRYLGGPNSGMCCPSFLSGALQLSQFREDFLLV